MSAQPRTSKRRRSDDEPPDDNGDDGDGDGGPKHKYKRPTTPQATPLKRQTRAFGANVDKGKVKQTRANEERSRARSHRQSPHPELCTSCSPAIDEKISLDASEVSAWADTVAAAGPPEKVDHIVFWSNDEDVRAPVRDWDNWRVSYKQPSRSAKFCSSDWVMYLHSIPLWLPSSYQKQ